MQDGCKLETLGAVSRLSCRGGDLPVQREVDLARLGAETLPWFTRAESSCDQRETLVWVLLIEAKRQVQLHMPARNSGRTCTTSKERSA